MGTMELAVVGLAGSGVGTALGVPMVWRRTAGEAEARLMGGWLLAASVVAALISARLLGFVPASAPVHHAINLVGFGAYPLLYLYLRELSGRSLRVRRAWWLWTPAAIYLAVLAVRVATGADTHVPFAWLLPGLAMFTALCASVAFGARAPVREGIVPARWLVGFLIAVNVSQVVRMSFGHVPLVPAVVPAVIAAGFLMIVGLVVCRALEARRGGEIPLSVPDAASSGPRYEKSGLDAASAAGLLSEVRRVLEQERLFTRPDLTLGRLASAVSATPHQVSEALNQYASTSFHELVCRLRVNEVKAQLTDPASDRFTIEGVGASAGFRSRSALYTAFRRLEATTPAEFRARVRAQSSRAPLN